jgi:hypothetical protein
MYDDQARFSFTSLLINLNTLKGPAEAHAGRYQET